MKPILQVIAEVPREDWHYWEKYYIAQYKNAGCKLVNTLSGGEGLSFGNQTSYKVGDGGKPIVAFNLDGTKHKEYKTVRETVADVGVYCVYHCVTNRQHTAGGFTWVYK